MTTDPNNQSPSSIYETKPKKKSFFSQPISWLVLLVVVLLGLAGALLFDKFTTGNNNAQTTKPETASSTIADNDFGKQAQELGIKKCAALFSNLGGTLVSGSSFDAIYSGSQEAPDESPISAVTGQVYTSTNGRGTGVVFASPLGKGCAGVLTRTILEQQPCADIAKQLPQGNERLRDLATTAVFRLPNNFNIMLMPASESSCVIITTINLTDKKE